LAVVARHRRAVALEVQFATVAAAAEVVDGGDRQGRARDRGLGRDRRAAGMGRAIVRRACQPGDIVLILSR
jgi:hypothetical protein